MTTPTLPDRLLAAKFRKRPLVIEAIQYIFDGTTRFADEAQDDIADFMGQNIVVVGDNIEIQTPEGPIYASPGDWIIRGVAGEFYPCKPDIFTATYEAEAAAALSAPEGDMARALEWVRAMVGDNAGSRMHLPAIEEAIVAYDPARAGARSGKGVTPPPGDGVVVPRALLEQVDSALMWDLHRRPYKHRVAQQKLIDLIREYAPAAPSAKVVA